MAMDTDNYIHIGFALLYLEFFVCFFNERIELLIFIFLSVLTMLSGFKIVMDFFSRPYLVLDINFIELFQSGGFGFFLNALFYPSIVIVTALLVIQLVSGNSILLYAIIDIIILTLYYLPKSNVLTFIKLSLWSVFSIPMIMNALAIGMTTLYATKLTNKNGRDISLSISKPNRKKLLHFKILFIINTLIIGIFSYMNLYGKAPPSKYMSYLIYLIIYSMSFGLLYLSNEISTISKI